MSSEPGSARLNRTNELPPCAPKPGTEDLRVKTACGALAVSPQANSSVDVGLLLWTSASPRQGLEFQLRPPHSKPILITNGLIATFYCRNKTLAVTLFHLHYELSPLQDLKD